MRHSKRIDPARARLIVQILTTGLLVVCLVPAASASALAQKKAAARAQFDRAEKMRTALEGRPQKDRTVEEYASLISAYRKVYRITPRATEVTAALEAVAELYQQMGRQFSPKYFPSAIGAYQFLLDQYPNSRHCEDALFTIAQIQREDLDQLDAAEKTFQDLLHRYPRSPKAIEAREALADIAEARRERSQPKSQQALAEETERERQLPRVTSIRHWNAENYTRIVIDLEDAVKYQAARIPHPDRIYFDIYKARLSPALSGKTLEVGDGFLKSIRVAQNQAGVVRVVLDADKVKDYTAFLLPNPYRLVIDVRGEATVAAKRTNPSRTAEAGVKSDTKAESRPATTESASASPSLGGPGPRTSRGTRPTAREAAAALGPAPVPQPTRNGQHSLTRALGLKIGRIVIDPGHGGHDTGTIGSNGLMEKDLCLDVALRLGKLIQARLPGAAVIYTRKDDSFVPLEERTAVANQEKADLFISIHANSSHNHKAHGVETYYLNFATSEDALEVAARENALSQSSIHELQDLLKKIASNEKAEESRELAADVQESLVSQLERKRRKAPSRGVKKAPFVVLIGANMPSVLTEVSFLSNPGDERTLKKPDQRERVAEGLFHGIQKYLASLNSLSYNVPKASAGER